MTKTSLIERAFASMLLFDFRHCPGHQRLVVVSLLLFGVFVDGLAQTPDDQVLGKVNIATPNAAALGKFGDIPVSYHTGVPNISIPLYTLKEGDLTVPISLSYHAGGIRVDEHASNVGLGWALNAGGVITRTVKDKPDERYGASSQQYYGYFSDYGLSGAYNGFNQGKLPNSGLGFDAEPDLFSFNFNGYSGKFWFNDDRSIVVAPQQDLKITYTYPPDGNPNIGQWTSSPGAWAGFGWPITAFTITTPDGTQYYFGVPAVSAPAPYCDPIEVVSTETLTNGTSYSQTISSWYLQKIVSSDGGTEITFNYLRDYYATYTFCNPPMGLFGASGGVYYSPIKNLTAGVFLSQIQGPNTTVNFTKGLVRKDLSGWDRGFTSMADAKNNNSTSLGGLQVVNNNGTCLKNYVLYQDYFVDTVNPPFIWFTGITYDAQKLRLVALRETSCDGTTTKNPPYLFTYFGENVPRSLAMSRDHWGFNNGASSNTNLYVYPSAFIGPTANRDPSWPAMRAGTLSQITYPTGGFDSFTYESHTTMVNQQQQLGVVGGLRIKTLMSFDPVSNDTTVTNYSYASGALYSRPVYAQYFRNDWLMNSVYMNNQPSCPSCPYTGFWNCPNGGVQSQVWSDNPLRPMSDVNGSHIGYSTVVVTQPKNGSSSYDYYISPAYQNSSPVATTSVATLSCIDLTVPNYPAAPDSVDYMRGELLHEAHYNQASQLLNEKYYTPVYTYSSFSTPGRLCQSFLNGSQDFDALTYYALRTAKKTQLTVIEKDYQSGVAVSKTTITNFGSPYHSQPTDIVSSDTEGRTVEKKNQYTFDFAVPFTPSSCVNRSACAGADFIKFMNQQWISGGYGAIFSSFGGYINGLTAWDNAELQFETAIYSPRYNWSMNRMSNYVNTVSAISNYQTNHNTAKTSANSELGPLLSAQDLFINTPVEQTELVNGKVTRSAYTMFTTGDNTVHPLKSMKLDVATPTTLTSAALSGNSITKDSRYLDDVLVSYSGNRVVTVTPRSGVPIAYKWGYLNSFPVLKVSNANNMPALQEVFYEGFEENYSPTLTTMTAHTGRLAWNGNSPFIVPFTPPLTNKRNYTLQYWTYSGGIWSMTQQPYTYAGTGSQVQLSGIIDDVRIFPVDAEVMTYTYEPGLGITSQMDPNGLANYYNYDNMGRLSTVSDQNLNMLKTYSYNYTSSGQSFQLTTPVMIQGGACQNINCSSGPGSSLGSATFNYTFTSTLAGPFTLTFAGIQPDQNVTMSSTLTGQGTNVSSYFCLDTAANDGSSGCGNTPSTMNIAWLPAGTYTLSYSFSVTSYKTLGGSFNACFNAIYATAQTVNQN